MPPPLSIPSAFGPLTARMLAFLAPLVLTNVVQALSGTLNTLYLGRLLGPAAMAAAASFMPLLALLLAFVIGLGVGAGILVGQAWGRQDLPALRRVAGAVLAGGAVLGAAIAAAGLAASGPLMAWLGTPPDVLPQAVAYARVMMLALPPLFISMLAAALMRGMGDTVTPLRMLLVTAGVSLVLAPALITGWGWLPRLGVAGAAWATCIAYAVAVGWWLRRLARTGHPLAPALLRPHLRLDGPLLATIVRLGVPTGLFFAASAAADLALLSLVHRHGSQATAAWGVVSQVLTYVQFPAMSIAIAASVFAAQAIGAGRPQLLERVARVGLLLNVVLTGAVAVAAAWGAPALARLFVADEAVAALAATLLRIGAAGTVIFGWASVFSGVMRAAGTVRVPTLISLGCIAFLLVPLGWWFDGMGGLQALWFAYPAAYACGLALQAAYFHGVWKRRPVQALV